jgi:hypothetical protein
VEANWHDPVFFLEIKPHLSLPYDSKREEADEKMRRRFRDHTTILNIPTLHRVSAFGIRLGFYEYNLATHDIQPTEVP